MSIVTTNFFENIFQRWKEGGRYVESQIRQTQTIKIKWTSQQQNQRLIQRRVGNLLEHATHKNGYWAFTQKSVMIADTKKESANEVKPLADCLFGGGCGIRTHVPGRANAFRVHPVMTTSITLRVYFHRQNPQKTLWKMRRKDGEKTVIKLYSNSPKTLIYQGFPRWNRANWSADFESGMQNGR